MKKLEIIISKILLILITISLVVFSRTPENMVVYGAVSGSDIVEYAKKWIGVTPYVWGGTSLTTGADCSGFVMKIFEQFGINLPKGTSNLESQGNTVSWNDIQLGDVIITRSSQSESGKHTGIYAGNGQWVNAKGKNYGTVLSSVPTSNIITIRRIIGAVEGNEKVPTLFPNESSGYGGYTTQDEPDDEDVDLDALIFEFSGNPSRMTYEGKVKVNQWSFSKFSQFIDYLLGVMIQGIKGAIVGWTSIVEGMINNVLDLLNYGS